MIIRINSEQSRLKVFSTTVCIKASWLKSLHTVFYYYDCQRVIARALSLFLIQLPWITLYNWTIGSFIFWIIQRCWFVCINLLLKAIPVQKIRRYWNDRLKPYRSYYSQLFDWYCLSHMYIMIGQLLFFSLY